MLIIIGSAGCAGLFGDIFPETEYVIASENAEVNSKSSAVIAKSGAFGVLNALGVIVEENENSEYDIVLDNAKISRGIQLIVCGNSPKNTVTITSRTPEMITLALNRAVKTQNGICEPLELPVKFLKGYSEFDYMSAFAASILLWGNFAK